MPSSTVAPPDARALRLAKAVFWVHPGISPPFVFASLPAGEGVIHRVAVDVENRRFYCSCPFRPHPCVHARALLQFFQETGPASFSAAEALPAWVQNLLAGPGQALLLPAADPAIARQQRRDERLERAADGFDDLENWLLDTFRRGLATTVSEDPQWAENIAARMADASLTGVSRTLRLLGALPQGRPDWAEKTLAGLADLYLALRAFRQREHLPEPLLADLRNWIGIPSRKEEILAQGERLADHWRVMGQTEATVEDRLKARRTWLWGRESRRYALLMDYAFGGEPFAPGWPTGTTHSGTITWYPSAWPLRALTGEDFHPVPNTDHPSGYADFQALADGYAAALGQQPWLTLFPAALGAVTVFFQKEQLYALDRAGKILPLQAGEMMIWRLLAVAGGVPVMLFGEWDGKAFWPLTAEVAGRGVEMSR